MKRDDDKRGFTMKIESAWNDAWNYSDTLWNENNNKWKFKNIEKMNRSRKNNRK